MIPPAQPPGIALLCNSDGIMLEIICDELQLLEHLRPGQPITSLFDHGSLTKAQDFLAALRSQVTIFDWELNLRLEGQIKLAYFSGVVIDRGILIVSTLERSSEKRFYEELARINNEQANSLRGMLSDRAAQARVPQEGERSIYNDFTRLNNELISTQRELTRKNDELKKLHAETEVLLSAIKHILIAVSKDGRIRRWNQAAVTSFGLKKEAVIGQSITECHIPWNFPDILDCFTEAIAQPQTVLRREISYTCADSGTRILQLTFHAFHQAHQPSSGCLLIGQDITEMREIEGRLQQAQKMESIGQLAAGIAHEINTPTQYVGDNTRFLQDSFHDLYAVLEKNEQLVKACRGNTLTTELLTEMETAIDQADIEYLSDEIPKAIEQALIGVERISRIVQSMKEFAHPGSNHKQPTDLNRAIENTITIAQNQWKYVAEVETAFEPNLPFVPCFAGEFNQVILNLIVNATHAITDVIEACQQTKGLIRISTRSAEEWVEIRISDTGTGIPPQARSRIFDPFFTTKDVGKGTGQGLAISHNVIVEKHKGQLSFETEMGQGTTFIIRLPLAEPAPINNPR